MEKERLQMSESFFLVSILAIAGGFLDAYSYLIRGKVFANAQTGNIVLFGVCMEQGNYGRAFYYFIPIMAFAFGVLLVELVKQKFKEEHRVHWRQRVVLLEVLLLAAVGMLPVGKADVIANVLISFVCAMQVESFRRVHGHPFASTMCTGNLRSGTESFFHYFHTGKKEFLEKGVRYYGVIAFFICGAVLGGLLAKQFGGKSVYFCSVLLSIAAMVMVKEYRK